MSPELEQTIGLLIQSLSFVVHETRDAWTQQERDAFASQINDARLLVDRISKGIPLWSNVPNEYEWRVMESDGNWYGYGNKPVQSAVEGQWMLAFDDEQYMLEWLGTKSDPSIIDWRTSLEKRPDNAPYIER